jgi:hypothetical protein
MKNRGQCERKWLWPILKYLRIFLEGQGNHGENCGRLHVLQNFTYKYHFNFEGRKLNNKQKHICILGYFK